MNRNQTMQAAVTTAYGGPEVVRVQTRPVPALKDRDVLIKVRAATVDAADARLRALDAPRGMKLAMRLVVGVARPRRPVFGTAASGTVVAVGRAVTRFKPGDAVIAYSGMTLRAHAQYLALPETRPVVLKPDNLSFEDAAALPFGGTAALDFLRKAEIRPGEHVLVIGASGAVGTAMVQLARHFGARVTAVTSTGNMDLVRDLGADAVIDYTREDYTKVSAAYDIVADTVGASSFAKSLAALKPGGRYLAIAGGLGDLLARSRDGRRSIAGVAAERVEDVAFLADLAAGGQYRPVVDKVFSLSEIAAAHAYVDTRRKRGSVVVRMVE